MAVQVQSAIEIARPIDEVFEVIADVANHPKWAGSVDDVRNLSHNPLQVGATWIQVSRFLGVDISSQAQAVVFDPPYELIGTSSKPLPGQVAWQAEEIDGGTRVTLTIDLEPQGVLKLAEPVLKNMVQSQIDKDLSSLKDILES